jgi:hypothetical protein
VLCHYRSVGCAAGDSEVTRQVARLVPLGIEREGGRNDVGFEFIDIVVMGTDVGHIDENG